MGKWHGEAALLDAKRELYHQLLEKPNELWTKTELELGFQLMQDSDIQKLLGERLKAAKP